MRIRSTPRTRPRVVAFAWQLRHCAQVAALVCVALVLLLAPACGQTELPPQYNTGSPSPEPAEVDSNRGIALPQVDDEFWSAVGTDGAMGEAAPPAGSYTDGLHVNPLFRSISQWFFEYYYRVGDDAEVGWTGDHQHCNAGTTAQALRDAVLGRVNYYRAMAGVPSITRLVDDYNAFAQSAALMISINASLSHWPDESWACYSAAGYEGASHSLLFLGGNGCRAIDAYVKDPGEANAFVPHRRMLLYPHTKTMGSGDLPAVDPYLAANALWVLGTMSLVRPTTRDGFVAWPPPGYVPYQVVFPRWSFSQDRADFASAKVMMTSEGEQLPLMLLAPVDGFGENTTVWEPLFDLGTKPDHDRWFSIEVSDVRIGQRTYRYSYTVIVFDPDA